MTCRHVNLGGVGAILCTRQKPKRVHLQCSDTSREWPACGANNCGATLSVTVDRLRVNCRRCWAKIRQTNPDYRQQIIPGLK